MATKAIITSRFVEAARKAAAWSGLHRRRLPAKPVRIRRPSEPFRACGKSTGLPDLAATAKLPLWGTCELAYHGPLRPDDPNDVAVYLVEEDLGRSGRAYLETDAAEADRGTIIRNFISGQYDTPVRVVAFNTAEGWSRDVSEDIAYEVLDQAHKADETFTDGAKWFIDRYVTPGEKRPPSPSVRRDTGADRASKVGGRKAGA
jgi:hypothetical protein